MCLVLAGAFLLLANPADARRDYQCSASGISDQFDTFFFTASKRHLPLELRENWCLLKAQCFVESRLKPDAVSPANAMGICQVLPSTAKDLEHRGFWRGKLRRAKDNIEAGAIVLKQMWNLWIFDRTTECRYTLAVASYNTGGGNVIEAQKLSGGRRCWPDIAPFMHEVIGKHSIENLAYVHRVKNAYYKLRGFGL